MRTTRFRNEIRYQLLLSVRTVITDCYSAKRDAESWQIGLEINSWNKDYNILYVCCILANRDTHCWLKRRQDNPTIERLHFCHWCSTGDCHGLLSFWHPRKFIIEDENIILSIALASMQDKLCQLRWYMECSQKLTIWRKRVTYLALL